MDLSELVAGKGAATRYALLAGVSALALGAAGPAQAGNILLTGHDNDFHCGSGPGFPTGASGPCAVLGAEAAFVRNGSALPVLVIDNGTELSSALTFEGVPIVVKTVAAVTDADFNHSVYSAFAVASVITCGGCDNPVGSGTLLATHEAAILSFLTAGGGILGMTSATDPLGFAYVPDSTGLTSSISGTAGFFTTADGLTIPGFSAINGDSTHNKFSEPGTGGESSGYKVAERRSTDSDAPITIFGGFVGACTGAGCTITAVPEPASMSLLGAGLFGFGVAWRRRRRSATPAAA